MLSPSEVTAVIPTKGDVDMSLVVNSLPFDDVIVWDNSERANVACYGRFAAIEEAETDWIFTQDDDIVVPVAAMLRQFNPLEPGVFANKPVPEEWRFLGVGALFHRTLIDGVFERYTDLYGFDDDFFRICDVVFAYQHPYTWDWFGYAELEWSRWGNRMYPQPGHMETRHRARTRTLALPEHINA